MNGEFDLASYIHSCAEFIAAHADTIKVIAFADGADVLASRGRLIYLPPNVTHEDYVAWHDERVARRQARRQRAGLA